jgi:hypothetical protein
MFFESALAGKNQFWRYLILFIGAFLAANTIGAIPIGIVMGIAIAKDPSILESAGANIADLSIYGVSQNVGLILMIIPFIVGLIALFLLIKPLNQRSYKTLFNGMGSIRWRRFFLSFIVWGAIMFIYLVVSLKIDHENYSLNNRSVSLLILAIISITLIPFQSTFEEVLFRGYLMQGIGAWTRSKIIPLLISSLMFGLMHSFNPEIKEFGFWLMMPQYVIFGLIFGLVTVLDNGIELAMGAHAANNIFLSVLLTQKASALQTPALYVQNEVYPVNDLISLIAIAVLFVVLLSYIYGWNWRENFKFKNISTPQ